MLTRVKDSSLSSFMLCDAVEDPVVRKNGFVRPFDTHQVASWAVLAFCVAAFFTLFTPIEIDAAGIALDCLYGIITLLVLYTGVMSMLIDPADDGSIGARHSQATGAVPPAPAPGATNHCQLCEARVQPRSKHCRR